MLTSYWQALPVQERNNLIGDLIQGEPMEALYYALDGKPLWRHPRKVSDFDDCVANVTLWQKDDHHWKTWKNAWDQLNDTMRGRITVVIERWHIRYSDTPGGGWVVIEAMRKAGLLIRITCQNPSFGWLVEAYKNDGLKPIAHNAATMEEAACLAAVEVLDVPY